MTNGESTGDARATTSPLARRLELVNEVVGRTCAWLTLAMVLATALIVLLRYVFDLGFIWLQEGLTWMHAAVFMLGAGWTLSRDEHVRVDVFYRQMSESRRAIVNLVGVLVFLLPMAGFLFIESIDYVAAAWQAREVSRDAGGLPYPAIPLMKTMLLGMPLLLALQGLAMIIAAIQQLRRD